MLKRLAGSVATQAVRGRVSSAAALRLTSNVEVSRRVPASLVRFYRPSAPVKNEQKPEESKTEEQKPEEPKESPEDALKAKITELEGRNKDLQDKVLRALAEMENVRKIAARDVQSAREFAIQSFAKSLLDVADNLERAVDSVAEPEDANSPVGALLTGVKMTSDQLQKTFRASGIQKVGAVGEKFDPQFHDAMFEMDDPSKDPGTICQLMKVGYTLNSRLIRPAQVGTVKARE